MKQLYYPNDHRSFTSPNRRLFVQGTGTISQPPDTVHIQLEVITRNEQLDVAKQENDLRMNQVIRALLEFGVPRDQIQTTYFQLRPIYENKNGNLELVTYEVQNNITVRIKDLDQISQVITIAQQAGANQIFNLKFSIENVDAYERYALQKALEDALAKAQSIANQMSLMLDPVPVTIKEEVAEQPIPFLKTSLTEYQSATPIEPGLIPISASVHVEFQFQS